MLTTAGIDPAVWTARDVQNELEAEMRRTGGTWPDQVTNPGAFLASRLRRLGSFAGRQPARAASPLRTSAPESAKPPQPAGAVTGTGRAEAFAELAAARRRAQHRRTAAAAAEAARLDALIGTARAVTPPSQPITVWR